MIEFLHALGAWFAENTAELLSAFAAIISAVGVFAVARSQSLQAEAEKQTQKKNTWHKEMLSTEKIDAHAKEVEEVLNDSTLSKQEKCTALNTKMLDFFYNVVNYVSFFDLVQYETLKTNIMSAMDNVMFSVVYQEKPLTADDVDKIMDVYKMKLTYHFYKIDIDQK